MGVSRVSRSEDEQRHEDERWTVDGS